MSLLDVFPNWLTLISFRYTSLTSTTLLGSLTVPSTMFFSRHILSKIFRPHHYIGVLLCIIGGSLTIYMDSFVNDDDDSTTPTLHSHSYIGDLLAIIAGVIYGLGDSIAEYCVKHIDRHEYLGMLGLFGALLTGATFPWIEHKSFNDLMGTSTEEKLQVVAVLLCYVLSVFLYYETEAMFLIASDATLLNLSMQSVNLWAVLFSITAYQDSVPPLLFFVALVLVVIGVFVYEMGWHCCYCNERCKYQRRTRSPSEVEVVRESQLAINYQSLIVD